jgi:integrase/recombinase XerD
LSKAKVPTEAERKRLLVMTGAGRHGLRNLAIIHVSYFLGLRAMEIAALRVDTVVGQRGELLEEILLRGYMTKGGKERVAYLTHHALRASLKAYLNERRTEQGILFRTDSPLFLSQRDNAFSPNTMQQLLHKLHARAGIVGGRSHSGRRSLATHLIAKGIDLRSVQRILGHASISTTIEYAEDNPVMLRRILAEVG